MKTIKCNCGEFIEMTEDSITCQHCLTVHEQRKEKYRFFCPECQKGFNSLVQICPTCNTIAPTKEFPNPVQFKQLEAVYNYKNPNYGKIFSPPPVIEEIEDEDEIEEVVVEVQEKPRSSFLRNVVLGLFCFHSGFTATNSLEYVVLKRMMDRR